MIKIVILFNCQEFQAQTLKKYLRKTMAELENLIIHLLYTQLNNNN